MAAAAVAFGLAGCSDWDDHYAQDGGASGGSGASLWATISGNEKLSDFASLLQRTGYDQILATDQTYTVWAPENGSLDMTTLTAMTDSAIVAELIKNHVTRGSYLASGKVNERVHLLNGKVKTFEGAGAAYTMDGISLDETNIPVGNGVLHTLAGRMSFEPNLYEYLYRDDNTSDIAALFTKYATKEIDTENSVAGPTKNGELTYLDTVIVEDNDLFYTIDAKMDVEDSAYTMVLPTNNAWQKAKEHLSSYYTYPSTGQFTKYTISVKEGQLDVASGEKVAVDADSLRNSNSELAILNDLLFSHNVYGNGKLENGTTGLDSLVSTTRGVFKNTVTRTDGTELRLNDASDIFADPKGQWVELSNGRAYVADSLRHRPWLGWAPILKSYAVSVGIGATSASSAGGVRVSSSERIDTVPGSLHDAGSYYMVTANGTGSKPAAYFDAPALLSTSYAVYMTMVPSNLTDSASTPKKVSVRVGSFLNRVNGESASSRFTNISRYVDEIDGKHSSRDIVYDFDVNDRVLTRYVGTISPAVSYAGVDDVNPYLSVEVQEEAVKRNQQTGFDNNLRIVSFLYVPMELVNYYRNQGVYDDYTGDMPDFFWDLYNSKRNTSVSYGSY